MKMIRGILLIDDDPIVNFINGKIMESEFPGVPVKIFINGLDALKFLDKNAENNFLIFLDINMPVMNGWEFLEAISLHQDKYDLQIYLLTSSVDSRDQLKANQYEQVRSFLHKPLTKPQLLEVKKTIEEQ